MQIKEDLELIEVKRNNKNTNLDLIFLEKEKNEVYTVHFNKQKWSKTQNEFVDNAEKEQLTNDIMIEHFERDFENIEEAIGQKHDIFVYDDKEKPFCSVYEVSEIQKCDEHFFKKYRGGVQTKIENIIDTGERIQIIFMVDSQRYASNKTNELSLKYGQWVNSMKKFLPDAVLKTQVFSNFEAIFKIKFEDKDKLIGTNIKIFPCLSGKFYFIEFEVL